jgi:hypothetical protein
MLGSVISFRRKGMSIGITIYGAGMAGLMAAHMLRRFQPIVFEAQSSLPNNHDALLRFRSDAVSQATGIPFQKVRVQKAICYKGQFITEPDLRLTNLYSHKVTGRTLSRSILSLEPVDRYIAPPDFIKQLSVGIDVQYNHKLESLLTCGSEPAISTIPMPHMMELAEWKEVPEFEHRSIVTIVAELNNVDVYQTLYYPGAEDWYRASITGNKLMIESVGPKFEEHALETQVMRVLNDFGICPSFFGEIHQTYQHLGKIIPIDNQIRKTFILSLTDKHNIYSLGRFATWRQILLDDVVEDVKFIEQCITQRDLYKTRMASVR